MTDFFYTIIKETVSYDDQEKMSEYFALNLEDMRGWCEDMLDISQIPDGPFKSAFLSEMFGGDSDEPYKLWRYIQDICEPDFCEEHEQVLWKDGLKCSGCCAEESEEEKAGDYDAQSSLVPQIPPQNKSPLPG